MLKKFILMGIVLLACQKNPIAPKGEKLKHDFRITSLDNYKWGTTLLGVNYTLTNEGEESLLGFHIYITCISDDDLDDADNDDEIYKRDQEAVFLEPVPKDVAYANYFTVEMWDWVNKVEIDSIFWNEENS